jgi:hypothetical protein
LTTLSNSVHPYVASSAGEKLWGRISLFLVVPLVAAASVFVYNRESEHLHHLEEHPPHYVPWPHLRVRKMVRVRPAGGIVVLRTGSRLLTQFYF